MRSGSQTRINTSFRDRRGSASSRLTPIAGDRNDLRAVTIANLSRTVFLLLALGGLTGCDFPWLKSEPPAALLSKEDIATRDAPAELVFKGQLAGEPTFLLVNDCEVYRVERREKGGVQWTSVLAPDFYPFWTVCQRESLSFKDGALTVTLGRQAIGAGGCCATGGTYRSTDGRVWKKV